MGKLTRLNPANARGECRGKAPHKPLLLLCLLDMVEAGELPSRAFTRSPGLVLRFRSYGALVAERWPSRLDIRLPFFHLHTQGFWEALDATMRPAGSPETCSVCEMNAILSRPRSLGLRPVSWRCVIDPFHDSSPEAAEVLRPFQRDHAHALVIRDFEGSGWESRGLEDFEAATMQKLIASGWQEISCGVLIAEPELESWLRMESAHMGILLKDRARKRRDSLLKWREHLKEAIERNGGQLANGKPARPKEVFHSLLAHFAIPPASALFSFLAAKESLQGCSVGSFNRFVRILKNWFPQNEDGIADRSSS